ncbi:hypothetical protein DERP_014153 [Dermatophagoides pteronyssinus]|uniref:Uncharacterized protein n=1 Tax=Dermatophagoides pteronyssinus TaxID=6956 RepID=A0ABQ8IWD8_DERPT|nr:hypothetical protein DERP_014153 [Dermatophagoides pteronyssinus]
MDYHEPQTINRKRFNFTANMYAFYNDKLEVFAVMITIRLPTMMMKIIVQQSRSKLSTSLMLYKRKRFRVPTTNDLGESKFNNQN